MDTDLRKEKQKNDFKKDFGQNREKKELFSIRTKLSYYKVFHRTSISNRNEKNIYIYEYTLYLGLSILELSKILMYTFSYDYVRPKYV